MNIKEAKEEIVHTLQAYHEKDQEGNYVFPLVRQRPILLMGPPGIGKTAIMEQVARECEVGLVSYTITHHTRQSAIGLPNIKDKTYQGRRVSVTEYTLSEIIASVYDCMERTGKREGILFIDEINCVSETLAPTMLQFLQNKTFGSHKVPDGWLIVAAGNPPEYNKSVREFDIVTLDRVRRIDIQVDCDVWMEYAWEQKVHGAVLSYLNIRKENFYLVENTVDGKFFVTARGWEDLSQILKSYGRLRVPVIEQLVIQYLQKEEVARDFAVYYQLYCKYGEDYAIPEIVSGNIDPEVYGHRRDMARQAGFEERFTVVGLLLADLNHVFEEYADIDRKINALYEKLGAFKAVLKEQADIQSLQIFIQNGWEALNRKVQEGKVTQTEKAEQEWALKKLSAYDLALKKEHILDKQEGMDYVRGLFDRDLQHRGKVISETGGKLENAFRFVEDCFGMDQEMVLFVSGLSKNIKAMEFVGSHGSEAYFKYSEVLLYRKREEELKRACLEEAGLEMGDSR